MPNRRDLLKGVIAAGGVAAVGGSGNVRANWGMPLSQVEFDGSLLINRAQADAVLDEAGLDGLIAVHPVNVFYLGNHLGYYVKIQQPNASFAVYPRDPNKPTILVVPFGDLWNLANEVRDYPHIIPYSVPTNWQDYIGMQSTDEMPQAAQGFSDFWHMSEDTLSAREKVWLDMDRKFKGNFMPTPEHGLLKALKEAGLEKSKVAIDDIRTESLLKKVGHDTTVCVEGDNIFRKIRVVKSPVEIEHMRRIAQVNQTATMNAMRQVGLGATNADIDHIFRMEAAKLGAVVTWTVAGSIGGLPSGEMIAGEPILVDAVSQINYYHGDFGRTFVAGEPSKQVVEKTEMLRRGWLAALDMMRPGVRYSEIQEVAMKAMKGSSISDPNALVVPHSVGLQHTDEPYRDNVPFGMKDDLVLQEGMTMTVDFPSLELGWGNCHLEDLVVITKDGVEALGTIDDPLVVI